MFQIPVQKIKLFLVDDHRMVIDMWASMLAADPKFEIVGTSLDAEKALEEIKIKLPNVVLLDITLPGISGIDLAKSLREKVPTAKILGVSMHTNIILIKQMLMSGASGYVSKTSSFDEMKTAILSVNEGQRYICRDIKDYITNQVISENQIDPAYRINQLTKRELEIVNMIKDGHSSREISEKLFISKRTVEVHRYNILKKLQLHNTAALVNLISHADVLLPG